MVSWTVYVLTAVIAFIAYNFFGKDKRNLPRGPRGWPLLGNSLAFMPSIHVPLLKWPEKYGDICTIYMGMDRSILLSDPQLVREAFNDQALSGRPDNALFTLLPGGPHGVLSSEGQEWADQRRFTLRHLRDFGFGKTTGEELITNELREFIQGMAKQVGAPVSTNKTFGVAVLNTLWMILSGVRYEQDDPRLWAVLKQSEEISNKISRNPFTLFLPNIAVKFPKITGFQALVDMIQKLREISLEHINRHKADINYDDNPRDFIDAYLQEIKATKDPASSFYGTAGIKSLTAVVNDLFGAGSDTTSTTLSWLILYLAKFPQTQAKLQAELDEVIGKSRAPALADRSKLPFAEAFITESMRLSTITPFGLFHRAMKDVQFHGYDIPKGTFILANLYYIHYNPKIWGNPEDFQPERFLSEDGKMFKKHDAWMPFSVGKRQCLGETLARDTVFLYFVNISHRFSIELADESKDITLESKPGFARTPQDFKVILRERL